MAAALAAVYAIVNPPSGDLAAHMFRAHLFSLEPFSLWNNYWYDGHHTPGYSLLYPAVSAALTPQVAAALATTGTAAVFEALAYRHRGEEAWLGALLFAGATATDLYTGRLAFAFGTLPAMAAVLALDRRRLLPASILALLSGLCSPVAALFAALAAAAYAIAAAAGTRRPRAAVPGLTVLIAALLPVGMLALAFPEGGYEPFAFSALWPIPLLAVAALLAAPGHARALRIGIVIYGLGTIASYAVKTPVGSNATRLGTMLALPLAALLLWPRHRRLLLLAALPLAYLEWQAPVRDLVGATAQPADSTAYYQPLLAFLGRQPKPFRVEIPFTRFHWEAYAVAIHFPLARGWERQLDIKENRVFYDGSLDAAAYDRWLRANAVRFVAVPDAPLDYSGEAERALIDRGLPYLVPVERTRHWRIYAVKNAVPLAQGAATATALGPDWIGLDAHGPGSATIDVRFTPYWALTRGHGCVSETRDGFTRVTLRSAGPARLGIGFSLSRVGAKSRRCS